MLFASVLSLIAPIAAIASSKGSSALAEQCGYKCLAKRDCSQMSVEAFSTCISSQCLKSDESVTSAIEDFIAGCRSFAAQKVDPKALAAIDAMKDIYISSQMAIFKRQAANATAAGGNGTAGNGTNGTTSSGGTGTSGGAATTSGGITAGCTSLADVLSGVCIASAASATTVTGFTLAAAFLFAAAI